MTFIDRICAYFDPGPRTRFDGLGMGDTREVRSARAEYQRALDVEHARILEMVDQLRADISAGRIAPLGWRK